MRKLYITLRRSFAGTKDTQRRTLQSLGLRYREQTVIQDNNSTTRGAIDKVRSSGRTSGQILQYRQGQLVPAGALESFVMHTCLWRMHQRQLRRFISAGSQNAKVIILTVTLQTVCPSWLHSQVKHLVEVEVDHAFAARKAAEAAARAHREPIRVMHHTQG